MVNAWFEHDISFDLAYIKNIMFIQTEDTPNPNTMKFLPGQPVKSGRPAEFTNLDEAQASPLAAALFQMQGVSGVFFGLDFISVTKNDDADWTLLKTPILAAVMDHYTTGQPLFHPGREPKETDAGSAKAKASSLDDEISNQILELIDSRVRPAVAQDGGDIEFHDYDDGIVYLRLRGACAGCPSSTVTLKSGIENMLKHFIPEIQEVRALD